MKDELLQGFYLNPSMVKPVLEPVGMSRDRHTRQLSAATHLSF
jgi:hypothetical protein